MQTCVSHRCGEVEHDVLATTCAHQWRVQTGWRILLSFLSLLSSAMGNRLIIATLSRKALATQHRLGTLMPQHLHHNTYNYFIWQNIISIGGKSYSVWTTYGSVTGWLNGACMCFSEIPKDTPVYYYCLRGLAWLWVYDWSLRHFNSCLS